MTIFDKRWVYKLGGGTVTVLLGVLAAAGAQRQGVDVADVPPELRAPEWANIAPMPIAASPATSNPPTNFPSTIAQAGYAVDPMTDSEPKLTPAPNVGGPSFTGFGLPGSDANVQPVAYDEQPTNDLRAGAPAPSSEQIPPNSAAEGPAAFAMPTMYGPAGGDMPMDDAQVGPSDMAASSIQLPTIEVSSQTNSGPTQLAPMPELQMDAGPAVDLGPAYDMPNIPTPPDMGQNRELPPLPKPQPQSFASGQSPAQNQPLPRESAPSAYGYPTSDNVPTQSSFPAQGASFGVPRQTGIPTNAPNNEVIGQAEPGDRRLEGMQAPSIVIQKRGPTEVKIGQPATFVVHVQNVGSVEATNVQVLDRVPAGMQLIDATPQPSVTGDQLAWSLGSLPPGDERSITMNLVPHEEGELGSVARVTFEAAASVRTRSTRPELKIVQQVRRDVLIGQQLEIDLQVSNVGTGEATGVVMQVDVPEGLDHPRGRQLDNALGSLRPGETRREILRLRAVQPGVVENTVRLISDDAETVADTATIEVTSPQLNVELTGPNRRYLERQATYSVNLENRGTAAANNVELVAYLDRGFTFVSTENEGTYDPNRHAVLWSLPNLPAGASGSVPLTLLPVQQGEHAIRLEAAADLNMRAESSSNVLVESKAELTFSVADTADPIEVGGETAYEIRVQNNGSRDDTNIQVQMKLPPGLELIRTDADAESDGRGGVIFQSHPQLPAGDELVYRIAVRGVQPDAHVITVVVNSDQSRVPVTKQESTEVYSDQY